LQKSAISGTYCKNNKHLTTTFTLIFSVTILFSVSVGNVNRYLLNCIKRILGLLIGLEIKSEEMKSLLEKNMHSALTWTLFH
jgi:hypothetical protein